MRDAESRATKGTAMNRVLARLAAASGAFFVVAVVVGSVLNTAGSNVRDDGAVSVASYQRALTATNKIGWSLIVIGFIALLVFLAYIHRWLRRFEAPDGWLSTGVLGAGLLYLALQLGELVTVMAGRNPGDKLTTEIASTLLDLDEAAFTVSGLMFGMFVLLTAAHCTVYRALPRWLGLLGVCLGLLTAAAGGVGVANMGGDFPAPYVASLAWMLSLSILLTVRVGKQAVASTPATTGSATAVNNDGRPPRHAPGRTSARLRADP
jgi:hypothetical protein